MRASPVSLAAVPSLVGSAREVQETSFEREIRAMASGPLPAPHFLFEMPDGERLAAIGAAAVFEPTGASRFEAARAWMDHLLAAARTDAREPAAPLIALGGFGFDDRPASGWPVPGGRIWIPERLLHQSAGGRTRILRWERQTPAGAHEPARDGVAGAGALESIEWSRGDWTRAVEAALHRIEAGALTKVVLARSRLITGAGAFDPVRLYLALREAYPTCYRFFYRDERGAAFLGASPERLVSLRGDRVQADAVAGTARLDDRETSDASSRPDDPDSTRGLERALLADPKERSEHAFVVREVVAALESACERVTAEPIPEIQRLRHVLHLRTPIRAVAPAGSHVLDLVARIHPSPAVAGTPRAAALEMIRAWEPRGRGWYAGPIGWVDAGGDGAFTLGLRSALVVGDRALLHAGAGIVAGSDPDREWEECDAKMRALRDALS